MAGLKKVNDEMKNHVDNKVIVVDFTVAKVCEVFY